MSGPLEVGAPMYVRRPFGVWGTCDHCGHDAWVVVVERDYMDEPVSEACGGGCRNCAECSDLTGWDDDDEATP